MFYVISYDIPDNRRRTQLAKVLKGFGTRVQYSVFEAHLTRTEYNALKRAVDGVIDLSEDSVRYYALCGACVGRIEVPAVGEVTSAPQQSSFDLRCPLAHAKQIPLQFLGRQPRSLKIVQRF